MVDSRWAEDVATGLLMRPNRSKQLSRSGCVLRRARVCHLTLLTYILATPKRAQAVGQAASTDALPPTRSIILQSKTECGGFAGSPFFDRSYFVSGPV